MGNGTRVTLSTMNSAIVGTTVEYPFIVHVFRIYNAINYKVESSYY